VRITVAETLGVGDRGGSYETTGAMSERVIVDALLGDPRCSSVLTR
jgi:glucose-6-phosphate 1-dehydrogenase